MASSTIDTGLEYRQIPLNKCKFAIVDAADYEWLSKFTWHVADKGYAIHTANVNGKAKGIFMHRLIMGTPKGMHTDHIDCDKLNNRRSNLRVCTAWQNGCNLPPRTNSLSAFKGVTWHKLSGKWQSRIKFDKTTRHLGLYENEIDAAAAYNEAAPKYFGEFCQLNPIPADWVITTRNIPKPLNNLCKGKYSIPASSRYKGVSKVGVVRWVARIKTGGKLRHLGTFKTEDEAGIAYNAAAFDAWGDLAYLNLIDIRRRGSDD